MLQAPLYSSTAFHNAVTTSSLHGYRMADGVLGGLNLFKDFKILPILLVVLYMIGIFGGQKMMATRKPFDLKYPLAAWNAALSIFSFVGAAHTVPHILYNIFFQGFNHTICADAVSDWGSGPTGFWVQMFVLSKIPELVDTVFIVLRKKPLIFLHWYHHVTVLLYCWHAMATEAPQALYFVAMNYSVHAIMYGYYCLMGLKMVPKWFPPILITMAQLAQMFVGVFVQGSAMWMYFTRSQSDCPVSPENMIAGAVMYGSYFALFFQFLVKRFMKKPAKAEKSEPKTQPEMEPQPASDVPVKSMRKLSSELSRQLSKDMSKAAGLSDSDSDNEKKRNEIAEIAEKGTLMAEKEVLDVDGLKKRVR